MAQSIDLEHGHARGLAALPYLLRTMRPKDWIKNFFVFAAIAFSRDTERNIPSWLDFDKLITVGIAFVLFCMVASAIYLINDLVDIEKDRAHPKKRHRPLASGRLSPTVAKVAAVALLVIALPLGFVIDYTSNPVTGQNFDFGFILVTYLFIQGIAYSYYLKNIVILDIFTIAAGFVLRAVAGAVVINIEITHWLLICMGLLALFLGLSKRRAELVLLEGGAGEHRRILDEYSIPFLDQMISIVTASTLIAYTLFTTTAETLPLEPFPTMLLTVPFVIYAIFRYLYLVYKYGSGGSAAEVVLTDRPFAISLIIWGIIAVAVLASGSPM